MSVLFPGLFRNKLLLLFCFDRKAALLIAGFLSKVASGFYTASLSVSNLNLKMLVLAKGRKLQCREKNPGAWSRTQLGHIG